MRNVQISSAVLAIIMVALLAIPIGVTSNDVSIHTPGFNFSLSEEVTDVPYVWQEVNGFCFPSALSMVLQSMELDLSLYDILAASGSGFSMVSISVNEAMTFLPGVMVRQLPWFEFFTNLYGLEMQFYLDSSTDYGYTALQILGQWGSNAIDFGLATTTSTPFDVMRESIDAGYPLAISADTYYLPADDWDIIRDHVGPLQPGGVGHAIVIVGYNETSHEVQVHDPGVGLMAPNYGYPDDGRWNYTMSYADLNMAWQSAGYVIFRVSNGTGPVQDFEDRLGSYIAQRMIGNRSSYFEGYENYFYLGTGADAFRGIGLDMTLEPIREYCQHYMEVDKPNAIRALGHNLEFMMTMQYMAFRSSLDVLPELLPSMDLSTFIDQASDALPHMDVLSHNASITSGIDILPRDTILYNTFFDMASSFETSQDLDASITEYSDELDEIAEYLFAIADAWKAAGETLSNELGIQPAILGDMTVVIGGGVGFLVIGVVFVYWRRRPAIES